MQSGRIKVYFEAKGYGFIEDFDGHEIYFHYTVVEGVRPYEIVTGASVYFDAINTGLGMEAHRVRVVGSMSA